MMITRRLASFAGPLLVAGTSHGQPCEPFWSDQFRPQGLDDTVWSMAVFDDGSGPSLYVAGLFQKAGDAALNHIARLDGNVWSSPGSGTDDYVMALAACDECPDGAPSLYAGGLFRTAGGLAANGIARWDGTAWSGLGSEMEGRFSSVFAISILDDGTGPALFAAGVFIMPGGEPVMSIARWDGSAWAILGSGLTGAVQAMALFDDGSGLSLYAGGTFYEAGLIVGRVARWDGRSWTVIPGGPNGEVSALLAWDDGSGPALYAGGTFTSAGGQFANNLARWNGVAWSALPAQLNGAVSELIAFDDGSAAGPALYATGSFTLAGAIPASRIARWNGAAWTPLAEGLTHVGRALAAIDNGGGSPPLLFVGGEFSFAGQVSTAKVAWWNGSTWSGVTPPPGCLGILRGGCQRPGAI